MGTGIVAAIPIIFKPWKDNLSTSVDPEYFSENFFDNYDFHKEKGIHTIKTDLLIKNYRDFLVEFYSCIEEKIEMEILPNIGSYEEFETVFNRKVRNATTPYLEKDGGFFSCLGGECKDHWIFYDGSYEADLEVYRTFLHFEKLLPKAIKNPLANSVKFGIFG
jgi:hypothetical protein